MDAALHHHKVVSMDSEFPGFLRKTPRRSDELSAFADMKFNVDNMKIIQLGITLSDENGIIAGTWEFNFKFLIETEVFYDPKSIEFLKESGIDFEELRINGIDQLFFSNMFTHVLSRHRDLKWLTFHGLYDLAYMVKLVTKKPLPGELGLEKLAKILGVKRVGGSHQAGSDSLLTARVFARMKTMYGIEESRFVGFLYGVTTRICEPTDALARGSENKHITAIVRAEAIIKHDDRLVAYVPKKSRGHRQRLDIKPHSHSSLSLHVKSSGSMNENKKRVSGKRCFRSGNSNEDEHKKKKLLRRPRPDRINFANFGLETPTDMPEEWWHKSQAKGGIDVKLAIMKQMFATDLSTHHNCFSIPLKQIRDFSFLTEDEKRKLKEPKEKMRVTLMEPCGSESKMWLRQWNLKVAVPMC
ncbi:hypothetical protein GH714_001120 [Hevea brasiliensis]|uniref:poly(A)-specific ribonuclease n=1 Tax=Hevea brasiliensis TaxID=3981 RepID=A0A6A6KHH7_HEVBR|nr:hypothetical protein GH714_001120 [Hevea brasiliensis]